MIEKNGGCLTVSAGFCMQERQCRLALVFLGKQTQVVKIICKVIQKQYFCNTN